MLTGRNPVIKLSLPLPFQEEIFKVRTWPLYQSGGED